MPAGLWTIWLILAGRGFGKTRTGAETVRLWHRQGFRYVNLIGPTAGDIRDVMIKGESGILACCSPDERPQYIGNELRWPNGAVSLLLSAEEPERIRGKQHEKIWGDEVAAWRYQDSWDQAMFGLRLGSNPQAVVTTTPKPNKLVKDIINKKNREGKSVVYITRGTTYDNKANLAEAFYDSVITKYEGTRLGRQELDAELLEDNPNALWQLANIEQHRIQKLPADLERVVVGVDPAVTSNEESDDWGIVGAARDTSYPPHFYVFSDDTAVLSPNDAADKILSRYHSSKADRVVAEVNNGGDLIETILRAKDFGFAYSGVHASRGKITRAEPIAALYEQGRVHHIGTLSKLEDECCDYNPAITKKSPNRMDALVWALTELSEGAAGGWMVQGARLNAQAKKPEPLTEPEELESTLSSSQKEAAVTEHKQASGVFGEEKTMAGKVLTSKLAKPAVNAKTPECPSCGNKILAVLGDFKKCNQCGWTNRKAS